MQSKKERSEGVKDGEEAEVVYEKRTVIEMKRKLWMRKRGSCACEGDGDKIRDVEEGEIVYDKEIDMKMQGSCI